MDNYDLKYLKKHYGENFAHLCRELFPTILEKEGKLTEIITHSFAPNFFLYDDIIKENVVNDFKDFIYGFFDETVREKPKSKFTAEELMDKAGYILFPECKTEDDIQSFKKYYEENEKLCTFKGNRLDYCRVWFAVKKNVDEIKREDFTNPQRQDEYGTSVISIQFSKSSNSRLSIKNRYNHTVNNPDATFLNDLDNIIKGLSDAFIQEYRINYEREDEGFELPGYVFDKDYKMHKVNIEVDGVNYCNGNFMVGPMGSALFDKSKYIFADEYVIDLVDKKVYPAICVFNQDGMGEIIEKDAFVQSIGDIENIKISKRSNGDKEITFVSPKKEEVKILINIHNQIVEYSNDNITQIGDFFLNNNEHLRKIDIPKVSKIGCCFMSRNLDLEEISLPYIEKIEREFLANNKALKKVYLPNVKRIGGMFLYRSDLESIDLPSVKVIDEKFMGSAYNIKQINLPKVEKIGNFFLQSNNKIKEISLPKVEDIGNSFLVENRSLREVSLPRLRRVEGIFLSRTTNLKKISLPKVERIGRFFMFQNDSVEEVDLPKVKKIEAYFFENNNKIKNLFLPEVEFIGERFLFGNSVINEVNLPNVKEIGDWFLKDAIILKKIYMPKVRKIGDDFLSNNKGLRKLYLPEVQSIGDDFLFHNKDFETLYAPRLQHMKDDRWLKRFKHKIKRYCNVILEDIKEEFMREESPQEEKKEPLSLAQRIKLKVLRFFNSKSKDSSSNKDEISK